MLVALRVPGVDVVGLIQAHRKWLVELMQYFTRLKEDARGDEISLLVVADAEIYRLDAVIRWLDSTEARLRHLPAGALDAPAPAPRRRRAGALR